MAKFLKGKYKSFYSNQHAEVVKDVWRFTQVSDKVVLIKLTRKDADSPVCEKFIQTMEGRANFIPVDPSDPQLGGKV